MRYASFQFWPILALITGFSLACSPSDDPTSGSNDSLAETHATSGPTLPLTRVLVCEGDARIEVYLPASLGDGRGTATLVDNLGKAGTVLGGSILDLAPLNKGKSMESVKVSLTPDRKGIIVDQFTRGLPPTTVPLTGGTVDFDHRFAEQARCEPFDGNPDFKE